MGIIRKLSLWLSGLFAVVLIAGLFLDKAEVWQPAAVGTAVSLAIGFGAVSFLKSYQYTAWIVVAIVAGLIYPSAFLSWGDFDLRNKWVILVVVQLVMFGMGTQMSLKDFTGIKTMGRGVLIGLLCQFSVMPLLGFLLTRVFTFEPEIAAGIILIGSCSSGLASNVMVFIARANLTLSVTLTSCATLLAPLLTPLLMKLLAGTYVEISFINMCIQIVKIVIVPIGAALIYDAFRNGSPRLRKRILTVLLIAVTWLLAIFLGLWNYLDGHASLPVMRAVEVLNFLCGAIIVGVLYHYIVKVNPKINAIIPYFSMFGIIYFTTVTTAASRENILQVGVLILIASILHNTLGYLFGYWISRALRLDRDSARTVALEVGLQNGGMASGLAGVMGKLATLGLAAAIFSPWMNISGSLLANYWRRKPKTNKQQATGNRQ